MAKYDRRLCRGREGRPQIRDFKHPRFKTGWHGKFLAALGETCNVRAACRAAGISPPTAYRERRRSAQFRADWAVVLRDAYARLELELLDRALNGTVRTITRANGAVETIHEYPNAIALRLLVMHRQTAAEADRAYDPGEVEEARRSVAEKLDRLHERIEAERAEAAAGGGEAGGEEGAAGEEGTVPVPHGDASCGDAAGESDCPRAVAGTIGEAGTEGEDGTAAGDSPGAAPR